MVTLALRRVEGWGRRTFAFLAQFAAWCWQEGRTAHVVCILGGWALLTWGVARLLVVEVWMISGGLLLLSVAGWGHLRILSDAGLYALKSAGERK